MNEAPASQTAILEAINGVETRLTSKLTDLRNALQDEIATVGKDARDALNESKDAIAIAKQVQKDVNGSLPPGAGVAAVANALSGLNGNKPPPPSVSIRKQVSTQEGTITDVIGQIGKLQAAIAAQDKRSGVAEEGAKLGAKLYTFLMSREGLAFCLRVATIAALMWGGFKAHLAFQAITEQPKAAPTVYLPMPPPPAPAPPSSAP